MERLVADIPMDLKREIQARLLLYHDRRPLRELLIELLATWLEEDKQAKADAQVVV